ncbi:MAG: hypothetical protein ACREJT_03295, partial [Myxococcota bacterium]
MSRAAALALVVLATLASTGCGKQDSDYRHNRFDYWSFRARVGSLPEPNYLPWALHVETLPDGDEALVTCRWPDSAFPLRYFVHAPAIPEALAGDGPPRPAADYV